MRPFADRLLAAVGVRPRQFRALLAAFLRMDLRGQHFTRATGVKANEVFSPLFLVVGQCLVLSLIASAFLFARVEVFYFAGISLAVSMAVTAALVVVEFQEVVLDPNDLDILGHRPVPPRTYAAARFFNLLAYVGLIWLALNIFPAIVGAGLRDAGPWYAPAYVLASLAGTLATVAAVIVALSVGQAGQRLEGLKEVLAWTQILLILVAFYGAQLLLHDRTPAALPTFLEFGAFPPAWLEYPPPTWLARFVESAAVEGDPRSLGTAGALACVLALAVAGTVLRLSWIYAAMQPAAKPSRSRPWRRERLGRLPGPGGLLRGPEERVGFWLGGALLARDPELRLRCVLPLNTVLAAVVLGVATGQFANPLRESDPRSVMLPILAFYMLALLVPSMIFQFGLSRDHEAAWLLRAAPVRSPGGVARGLAKSLVLRIVVPAASGLGLVAAWQWRDPLSAVLHAGLGLALAWPLALAGIAMTLRDVPLSRPPERAATLGPVALTLAVMSAVVLSIAGLHYVLARQPAFWVVLFVASAVAVWPLGRWADRRQARVWRA